MNNNKDLVQITKDYYDSTEADEFYFHIWGGEDIHIGIYNDHNTSIREGSQRTVEKMIDLLPFINSSTKILDIGSGYGGAARTLANRYKCQVHCLNLSQTENDRNKQKTETAGLSQYIEITTGNFENIPFEEHSFDIVWSQDAILHSDKKKQVFREVYRMLKPEGRFIFTDPMQSDNCPDEVLGPVLQRIHLKEMGSIKRYRQELQELSFKEQQILQMPEQLVQHYSLVLSSLIKHHKVIVEKSGKVYVENMKLGLQHWIDAGKAGYLNWGILLFQK